MQLAGWQNTKAASSYSCFLVNECITIGARLYDQEETPHNSNISRHVLLKMCTALPRHLLYTAPSYDQRTEIGATALLFINIRSLPGWQEVCRSRIGHISMTKVLGVQGTVFLQFGCIKQFTLIYTDKHTGSPKIEARDEFDLGYFWLLRSHISLYQKEQLQFQDQFNLQCMSQASLGVYGK